MCLRRGAWETPVPTFLAGLGAGCGEGQPTTLAQASPGCLTLQTSALRPAGFLTVFFSLNIFLGKLYFYFLLLSCEVCFSKICVHSIRR